TLSGNLALGGANETASAVFDDFSITIIGGGAGQGGGVDAQIDLGALFTFPPPLSMALAITGSTLSGNVAQGGPGSGFAGGGALHTLAVTAQVTASTVSGSQALGGSAGGVFIE